MQNKKTWYSQIIFMDGKALSVHIYLFNIYWLLLHIRHCSRGLRYGSPMWTPGKKDCSKHRTVRAKVPGLGIALKEEQRGWDAGAEWVMGRLAVMFRETTGRGCGRQTTEGFAAVLLSVKRGAITGFWEDRWLLLLKDSLTVWGRSKESDSVIWARAMAVTTAVAMGVMRSWVLDTFWRQSQQNS